jgi:hypothetical protein
MAKVKVFDINKFEDYLEETKGSRILTEINKCDGKPATDNDILMGWYREVEQ